VNEVQAQPTPPEDGRSHGCATGLGEEEVSLSVQLSVPENKQRMSLAHRGSGHSGRKKVGTILQRLKKSYSW
jgi:hypothetical protein